jgi:hypothetical protein
MTSHCISLIIWFDRKVDEKGLVKEADAEAKPWYPTVTPNVP